MTRSHRWSAVAMLVALTTAAACSGGSEPSSVPSVSTSDDVTTSSAAGPSATTPPVAPSVATTEPTKPTGLVPGFGSGGLDGLAGELATLRRENDHRLPLDASLDLFAATLGPIPDGDPARFAVGEGEEVEGTLALRAVLSRWEELTPEQQDAARSAVGYPRRNSLMARGADPRDAAMQVRVDAARVELAARMGGDIGLAIAVEVVDDLGIFEGLAWPEAAGDFATSGRADTCRVQLLPGAHDSTVAHEVFHCFQFDRAADVADVNAGEDWIIEGSATWAGAEIAGIDDYALIRFEQWAGHSDSVFGLDYPAVGYFYTLEDMGLSPWEVLPRMLGLRGIDAVAASGLDPLKVLSHMATSPARAQSIDPIPVSATWDFDVDVPATGARAPFTITPDNGLEGDVSFGPFAKGPIVHITVEGGERVRVRVNSDVGTIEFFEREPTEWQQGFGREYCLDEGGCRCGVGDAVDSGLEQGGREFVLTAGELGPGLVNYDIRIPPAEEFTDGTWTGTIDSTSLTIFADGTVGERGFTEAPFEFTVENGAVTGGTFELGFGASVTVPQGVGSGVVTISGTFTGCGFAPQMVGSSFRFEGSMNLRGVDVPLEFTAPAGAGTPIPTVWLFTPSTNPDQRSGTLDEGGTLSAISLGGFATLGLDFSFRATRSD